MKAMDIKNYALRARILSWLLIILIPILIPLQLPGILIFLLVYCFGWYGFSCARKAVKIDPNSQVARKAKRLANIAIILGSIYIVAITVFSIIILTTT